MSTPDDEIYRFLVASHTDSSVAAELSLEFARRMCRELREALAEWEVAVDALEHRKSATGSATDS